VDRGKQFDLEHGEIVPCLATGARVIMACRDTRKASEAASEIRKQTEGVEGAGVVVVMQLDLSSLTSVRELAANILRSEPHIHLLVNNAGVYTLTKSWLRMV
jgi:NAD(P)-dependent dehydrogenase (short-subunit alcohol dehydrogenase family)